MKPKTIEKIRALASDPRGDPATRSRAQEKLRELEPEPPRPELRRSPPNRLHHGMRLDPLHTRRVFNDLSLWSRSKNGNLTHQIFLNGISYRLVLFRHKKADTYGWMRADDLNQDTQFSSPFPTLDEAHADSWASLMTL